MADIFTKPLGRVHFQRLRYKLGLRGPPKDAVESQEEQDTKNYDTVHIMVDAAPGEEEFWDPE
jgi:hypothetical protein